jgi:hypothetical protein
VRWGWRPYSALRAPYRSSSGVASGGEAGSPAEEGSDPAGAPPPGLPTTPSCALDKPLDSLALVTPTLLGRRGYVYIILEAVGLSTRPEPLQ